MSLAMSTRSAQSMSYPTFRISELTLTDPDDFGMMIRRIYESRSMKRELECEFETNIDFLKGGENQYRGWNESKTQRVDPEFDTGTLISFNMTLSAAETLVSRLVRGEKVAGARPVSDDQGDVQAAKTMEDVLNYQYTDVLHMDVGIARLILAMLVSPVVFQTGGWDPMRGNLIRTSFEEFEAGRMAEKFPQGMTGLSPFEIEAARFEVAGEFLQEFGETSAELKEVVQYAGQLFEELIFVNEMCWYPWFPKTWDDVRVYVWTTEEEISDVAEWHDLDPDEIREAIATVDGGPQGGPPLENRIEQAKARRIRQAGTTNQETILYHRAWVRKSTTYPEGLYGVAIGEQFQVLLPPGETTVGGIDNKDNEIPIFPLVNHDIPGQAPGTCMVSQVRSLQQRLNQALNQEAAFGDRAIMPTILIHEDSIPDEDNWEFDNRPGAINRYKGDKPPGILDRPNFQLETQRWFDNYQRSFREIAGIGAIQSGRTDQNSVRSGRAIQNLSEMLDERLVFVAKKIDLQQQNFWTFCAKELQTKPVGEHMARQIVGEGNELELFDWTREALQPSTWQQMNRPTALITVKAFSDMPLSRSENRNFVLTLIKGGVLRPMEHDAEIWRMLGGGETRSFRDRDRKDRAKQHYEIQLWKKGAIAPPPLPQQLHAIHIDEINEWIRGGNEYQQLIARYPYLEAHIAEHIRAHQRLAIAEPLKLQLLQSRVKAEVWFEAQQELEADVQAKVADPRLLEMMELLYPIEAIFGTPAAEPAQGGNPQNQGKNGQKPQTPKQPGGGKSAAKPNEQKRFPVGEGEGRDQRRDLADRGQDLAPM